MAYKIILEDRAIEEIDHAFDWYESQRSEFCKTLAIRTIRFRHALTPSCPSTFF